MISGDIVIAEQEDAPMAGFGPSDGLYHQNLSSGETWEVTANSSFRQQQICCKS